MNEVLQFKTVTERELTLREFADFLMHNDSDSCDALGELETLIWADKAMMQQLHAFAKFDPKAALSALLREIARSEPTGEDQSSVVEMTNEAVSSPAAAQLSSNLGLDAVTRAKRSTATSMLLVIDGTPIGDWTIGRCRTQARRKGREAEMLRKVLERCGHLPHTAEVGSVIDDAELKKIAESVA